MKSDKTHQESREETADRKPQRSTEDRAAASARGADRSGAEQTENTAAGAVLGGAVAGPLGALAGGAIGWSSTKKREQPAQR